MHDVVLRVLLTACLTTQVAPAHRPTTSHSTYVFVHGAWGGGWDWQRVDSLLTRRGHPVYRPSLTGLGERVHLASPNIGLSTHIDDVVNTILWENLRDVVWSVIATAAW
jgi:pimeloyl-ACP methyl ester carboxylesterase